MISIWTSLNCCFVELNHKSLDLSKLKTFAEDKLNVTQKLKFVWGEGRKPCGKKKQMLVTSILLFSHNVFNSLILKGHRNLGLFC